VHKKTVLGKNSPGNNGTNGKAGKNGTLMLHFPKPNPQTPSSNPIYENVPF